MVESFHNHFQNYEASAFSFENSCIVITLKVNLSKDYKHQLQQHISGTDFSDVIFYMALIAIEYPILTLGEDEFYKKISSFGPTSSKPAT